MLEKETGEARIKEKHEPCDFLFRDDGPEALQQAGALSLLGLWAGALRAARDTFEPVWRQQLGLLDLSAAQTDRSQKNALDPAFVVPGEVESVNTCL